MKKQLSTEEKDLKTTFELISLIPILIGGFFLFFIFFSDSSLGRNNEIRYFAIIMFVIGIISLFLVNRFLPYCYKIEAEGDKIYITKTEIILTTHIEKTIEVSKNSIKKITGGDLKFQVFSGRYTLYYLHLKEETEYGKEIAFLADKKPVIV